MNPLHPEPTYRVSIRATTYRGVDGFVVTATPYPREYEYFVEGRRYTASHGGSSRIFTVTRKGAERVRDVFKSGRGSKYIREATSEILLSEPKRSY